MNCIIAADIGGTYIKIGAVSENGELLQSVKVPTGANVESGVLDGIKSFIGQLQIPKLIIMGIAVSSAGQVDGRTGAILGSSGTIKDWGEHVSLRQRLEEAFAIPVSVDNDGNCAVLGEQWQGAGKNHENIIGITLGTGIGGGIIIEGQLLQGHLGIAGEIGHMTIKADGPLCTCGARGCWEQYASTSALVRKVKEESDGEAIFERAGMGDEYVLQCLDEFYEYIAIGLTSLIHIFNPSLIIIGGGISAQGESLVEPVKRKLEKLCMPAFYNSLTIKPAVLGNNAGMIGATKSWLSKRERGLLSEG